MLYVGLQQLLQILQKYVFLQIKTNNTVYTNTNTNYTVHTAFNKYKFTLHNFFFKYFNTGLILLKIRVVI